MNEHAVSLLEQILVEQKKQTNLLEQIATQSQSLIEVMAEEEAGCDEAQLLTYLSGSPIQRGY
ncbi:hypothetical protein [Pseudomonas putida]|uniref:Uncharacterized protein n=1 Tax=Pseudomonas putida TaxID=303 RepID=A0A8I1EDZ2_PSEPU|nr:hypothetical protein [Pseudomonas putida]MBI6884000.1 hypothetical protein [Pseudomonas putida]